MLSPASAKGILVALVCCVVLGEPAVARQPQAQAQTQQSPPQDVLEVAVDVFSGRRNPVFALNAADLQVLLPQLRVACTKVAAAPVPYPRVLGYRGLTIRRAGAASVVLARNGVRIVGSNPPAICRDLVSPTSDLFLTDPDSHLERTLVELAFRRGILDAAVHSAIVAQLNNR